MSDHYGKTRENIKAFHDPLEMPGGYSFSHVDTIKKIDAYYNGKFTTGARDSAGFTKYFYNIVKAPCDVAAKFIDLDTKDILLISERPDDERKIWFMQRDLKQWMKEQKIGKLLNTIGHDYPKYGTVVVKKVGNGKWAKVNIENLRMDTGADSLEDDSSFVYEAIRMTPRKIREMKAWDEVEVGRLLASKESDYIVYECYDVNDDGKKWTRSFRAGFLNAKHGQTFQRTAESRINLGADYASGFTLFEEEVDELPYRELHWERVPGRWLGQGFVEYLFDNQVRMNELANTKAKGLHFTSLKVFQTRDDAVARNLLTEVENGDILKVTSEVTPVAMEERNLAHFSQEEQRWDRNSDQKTFSFDIARGDDLPSATPLGVAKLSAGMVASYFELKRENFGLFVKDVILDDVIPEFKRQNRDQHLLKFLGSDAEIQKLYDTVTEAQIQNAVVKFVLSHGTVPTPDDVAKEKQRISTEVKKKKDIFVDIPKAFYDEANYNIDVIVTGEQVDVGARMQSLQNLMTIVSSNPMILHDPSARSILFKLMELAGVSPVELGILEDKVTSNPPPAQPGAQPQAPQAPMAPQQPPMGAPVNGVSPLPSLTQQPVMGQMAKAL